MSIQLSFKEWLQLFEIRDDWSDVEAFKVQTNHLLQTELKFPEYDWAGLALQTVVQACRKYNIAGQDAINMAITAVGRFTESMLGLNHGPGKGNRGGATGVGIGVASQDELQRVRRLAADNDLEHLIRWFANHMKLWVRTLVDYERDGGNRKVKTNNIGIESDADDYQPPVIASRQNTDHEYNWFKDRVMAELQRQANTLQGDKKARAMLAVRVAAEQLNDPLHPKKMGELVASFPEVNRRQMYDIMLQIGEVVKQVIARYGSPESQLQVSKIGQNLNKHAV